MEVIILSANNESWYENLYDRISDKFDTQLISASQLEDNIEIVDKPTVIVCNVDTYLDYWKLFESMSHLTNEYTPEYPNPNPKILAVMVVIDNVYFDANDTRFQGKSQHNFPLYVYGNVNNVWYKDIFRDATSIVNVNPGDNDFLGVIIANLLNLTIFPETIEPPFANGDRLSNSQSFPHRVSKVKIRGIFSNSKPNLSYLQKLSSK